MPNKYAAPGAAFQYRLSQRSIFFNVILDGELVSRQRGNHVQASTGEVLLLSTQPVSSVNTISTRQTVNADTTLWMPQQEGVGFKAGA